MKDNNYTTSHSHEDNMNRDDQIDREMLAYQSYIDRHSVSTSLHEKLLHIASEKPTKKRRISYKPFVTVAACLLIVLLFSNTSTRLFDQRKGSTDNSASGSSSNMEHEVSAGDEIDSNHSSIDSNLINGNETSLDFNQTTDHSDVSDFNPTYDSETYMPFDDIDSYRDFISDSMLALGTEIDESVLYPTLQYASPSTHIVTDYYTSYEFVIDDPTKLTPYITDGSNASKYVVNTSSLIALYDRIVTHFNTLICPIFNSTDFSKDILISRGYNRAEAKSFDADDHEPIDDYAYKTYTFGLLQDDSITIYQIYSDNVDAVWDYLMN